MKKAPSAENTLMPTRQMLRRTKHSIVILIVCFLLIIGQLGVLQIVKSESLAKAAVAQQLSDIEINANRGQIYDANMSILAQTIEVCTVIMCPKNIRQETTRVKIADEVSAMLSIDRNHLYEQASDSTSQYKVVAKQIDKALGDTFIEWVNENRLASVFYIITDYRRYYPLNHLLSNVLGFVNTSVGTSGSGAEGLEFLYNSTLSGTSGRLVTALNAMGDELPTELSYKSAVDAEDGYSLVLTVDQYIQQVTESYLSEAMTTTAADDRSVAIVMNVKTGAILAMATKGDYNLNEPRVVQDQTVATAIAQLSGDEQSAALLAALREQWRNKPVTDYYEPGSVFKAFTAAIGLEEGIVSEKTMFECKGAYYLPGVEPMRCHIYPRRHGTETFLDAIVNSCNPAFMTLGNTIGPHLFYKYYVGFGFTQKTGIDMPGERNVSSLLYHAEQNLTPVALATSSIGQTFKVTPLQMITAMSAIANGGYLMEPYIVSRVIDSKGNTVSATEPTVRRQVISEETALRLRDMLEQTVTIGAKNAYVAGYHVCGKTGTAVKTDSREDEENSDVWASFCGFAPGNDPEIAVLVIIDEPRNGQYGGTVSAPVAKKIMEKILPYLGFEPDYTEAELAKLNTTAPHVQGLGVNEAQTKLKSQSLGVLVLGEGTTVLQQVPAIGTSMPKDGTVVLYTDEESLEQTVVVPKLTGKTVAQVQNALRNTGLNLSMSGLGVDAGTAVSSAQSAEAGTRVPKGTVITVEFIYEDTIH